MVYFWPRLIIAVIAVILVLQLPLLNPARCDLLSAIRQDEKRTSTKSAVASIAPISLTELVNTRREDSCPEGLELVHDTVLNATMAYQVGRHIPRIIHVTAISRCMHPKFSETLDLWRLEDHSFFFHNDEAVDRLLNRPWPEFPHLQKAVRCITSGAAKADLWRALVLWEYGGIYTDIDNAPNLFDANTILPGDQAFFVREMGGFMSQYFMAAAPRHPLMYFLVTMTLHRLYGLNEYQAAYAPFVTGPGALKGAFIHFMSAQGPNLPQAPAKNPFSKPKAGLYVGLGNRTVRIVGKVINPDQYVKRSVIPAKWKIYRTMNMTHFNKVQMIESNTSCMQKIFLDESPSLLDKKQILW